MHYKAKIFYKMNKLKIPTISGKTVMTLSPFIGVLQSDEWIFEVDEQPREGYGIVNSQHYVKIQHGIAQAYKNKDVWKWQIYKILLKLKHSLG